MPIKRKDTKMINTIKSWNGKMPLTVSFGMVLGLEFLFMWLLDDIFGVRFYGWYNFVQKAFYVFLWMIFYAFCCFIQYFLLIFFRRFLIYNCYSDFYKIFKFYLISFLFIMGALFLFKLRELHILLSYITSWLGVLFFFKKIFLNPRFWNTIFWVSLFCIIMSFPFAFWGFIVLFQAATNGAEGTNDLIYGAYVGFGMSLLVVPSLVVLEYLINRTYYGKLSDIDKQNFKKYLKLSLIYAVLGFSLFCLWM